MKHRTKRPTVVVTLTCGCRTKTRDVPLRNAWMGCTSGLSHGYKLRWTSAVTESGNVFENRWLQEGKLA